MPQKHGKKPCLRGLINLDAISARRADILIWRASRSTASPTLVFVVFVVTLPGAAIGCGVVGDARVREANLIRLIDVQKRTSNRNAIACHVEVAVSAVEPFFQVLQSDPIGNMRSSRKNAAKSCRPDRPPFL